MPTVAIKVNIPVEANKRDEVSAEISRNVAQALQKPEQVNDILFSSY